MNTELIKRNLTKYYVFMNEIFEMREFRLKDIRQSMRKHKINNNVPYIIKELGFVKCCGNKIIPLIKPSNHHARLVYTMSYLKMRESDLRKKEIKIENIINGEKNKEKKIVFEYWEERMFNDLNDKLNEIRKCKKTD